MDRFQRFLHISLDCVKNITIVFILISSLFVFCSAEEKTQDIAGQLRNPFESWPRILKKRQEKLVMLNPPEETQALPEETVKLNLSGILRGKQNLAIINGEVVGEGDIIEGRKVIRINKKKVVLNGNGDRIVLEIKDDF